MVAFIFLDFLQHLHALPTAEIFAHLQSTHTEDQEFDLFLLTLLIIGLVSMLVTIVIGIILTLVLLVVIFGLISFGALSASVIIGIHKKSVTKGFKTFVMVFSTLVSALLGTIIFYILNRIVHWGETGAAMLYGLFFGLLGGFLFGLLLAFTIQKFSQFLKAKLDRKKPILDLDEQNRE